TSSHPHQNKKQPAAQAKARRTDAQRETVINVPPRMTRDPSLVGTLGDFTADSRVVMLAAMAALVGAISAFVALALVRLIGLFTNLAYFHRFDTSFASPAGNTLGLWAVGVPIVGGLIVGLMARYGSEKI